LHWHAGTVLLHGRHGSSDGPAAQRLHPDLDVGRGIADAAGHEEPPGDVDAIREKWRRQHDRVCTALHEWHFGEHLATGIEESQEQRARCSFRLEPEPAADLSRRDDREARGHDEPVAFVHLRRDDAGHIHVARGGNAQHSIARHSVRARGRENPERAGELPPCRSRKRCHGLRCEGWQCR
jgi:hypothetical protein